MAWQRKIPFGYMIRDGVVQPHPQETDAVRYIFGQYLAGASLLIIAEDMTRRGVRYHQHTAEWNKNMVRRILENTKYVGADGYPRLVPDENFAAAQHHRAERNTYAPLAAKIRPICGMVVCAQCGSKMARGTRSHGRVGWRCQNPDCGQVVTLSDEVLAELVNGQLQKLVQSPHLLTTPELKRAAPTMDAIRLQNELTMALNRGSEKPEHLKTLALAVTAQRYEQFPDPTPAHDLEQLHAQVEQGHADADTLANLLTIAVRAIRLTPSKNVELELVNGTIIAGKEAQSA
ncbi:MAG: hypothetical protein HDT33_09635 [Clostridiales bacterium]|nr:hypothetical protein [Clostridiales bacterium]